MSDAPISLSGYKHHKLWHINAVLDSGRPYHYRIEKAIILMCVRWYLAYALSYRHLEEMMEERGVQVDHTSIYRWVRKFTPKLEVVFQKDYKHPAGKSWGMDETSIQVKGQWKYLYRAVDKEGQLINFLLMTCWDKQAVLRFFKKAVEQPGLPEKFTIDKNGANNAALEIIKEETGQSIEIHQIKYLNNLVEQDHRAIKRIVGPMLGFKTFDSACCILRGIELMHRIKKAQIITLDGEALSAAEQFYALAA